MGSSLDDQSIVDSQVVKRGVDPRTAFAVVAALCVGGLAFVAGRSTASPDSEIADTTVPTTVPITAPPVQTLEMSLGPGSVAAEIEFDSGERSILLCSNSPDGNSFEYVQATRAGAGPALVEERRMLAADAGPNCGLCLSSVDYEIDTSDPVVYGDCRTGGLNGERTLFAIASPQGTGRSALALVIECGLGELVPGDGSLILRSQSAQVGDTHTALGFPDIELFREGPAFIPDDLELLQHYCISERSSQLEASRRVDKQARTQLSYETTDSEIGSVGVHGALLIGLTEPSCSAMRTAYWENLSAGSPDPAPIQTITGLAPPDGVQDWYIECQYPVG